MQKSLILTEEWDEYRRTLLDDSDDEDDNLEVYDSYQEFEFEFEEDMHAQLDPETREELMTTLNIGGDESSPSALMLVFGCVAHTVQLAVHDVL